LIFLIFLAQTAGAESIINVEVNESGNALWTMEKRVPLTLPEINEWDAIIRKGQNISRPQDTAELKNIITLFMSSAQNFSNRSMRIENFTISYDTAKTMSGGLGIIRYKFLWKNFSRTESGKIYIGDAFSRGMVLSPPNLLTIEIPSDYDVESVSPKFDRRDGNLLIWEGTLYQKFGIGEPALVLSRKSIIIDSWPVIVSIVVLISVVSIIFWKKRGSREIKGIEGQTKETEVTAIVNENNISGIEIDASKIEAPQIASAETQPSTDEITGDLTPFLSDIDLGDEEMIEKLLVKTGGQAYQSDIVKESGFSKSKISIVLAKMKEDGRIIKIKKGKENIIRLVKK
jgi:hypothetical protein